MYQSSQQQVALKLADLIHRAPAGGILDDAVIGLPVTVEGGPSRFLLQVPTRNIDDGIGNENEQRAFEITVTPLA